MKKRILTTMILFLYSVCGVFEVALANRIEPLTDLAKRVLEPEFVPGSNGWLRSVMFQESLLGYDDTVRWTNDLQRRIESGEIDLLEFASEMAKKSNREIGGELSKRRSKLAIRMVYSFAGIHPDFAKAFIQRVDRGINASQYAELHYGIDFSDVDIRPAKPYFTMTLETMDNSSDTFTITGTKMVAIKSIEDGYARFTGVDYEAAALTRMDKLSPSHYEKAVESHANLFDGGFYDPKIGNPAYRVEILSSPYFEFSERITDNSRLSTQLVLGVLNDISKGATEGFNKDSVLKLWNIVRNGDEKMNRAFRKAVGEMVFRNTLGDLRPEGGEQLAGGSFMRSFMEAVKEDEGLVRLFDEVTEEVSPSSTVSPSVIF